MLIGRSLCRSLPFCAIDGDFLVIIVIIVAAPIFRPLFINVLSIETCLHQYRCYLGLGVPAWINFENILNEAFTIGEAWRGNSAIALSDAAAGVICR